jgi:hypothetical protein
MKTKELMAIRYNDDTELFQSALHKIKPFTNVEGNIPLELIEKYIGMVHRKYAIQIDFITPVYVPDEKNLYSATIRNTSTDVYYDVVFETTLYALYAKIAILFWALTNPKKEFPLADWEGQKIKRANYIKERRLKK